MQILAAMTVMTDIELKISFDWSYIIFIRFIKIVLFVCFYERNCMAVNSMGFAADFGSLQGDLWELSSYIISYIVTFYFINDIP